MNRVVLTGRLTAMPELKTTQSGISVTSFTVAVKRKFKDSDGNFTADFIDCVAWRQSAEFITRFFSKGDMIALDGFLQTRVWQDKSGNNRKAVEIIVDNAEFCQEKREDEQKKSYALPDEYENISNDEDLPF